MSGQTVGRKLLSSLWALLPVYSIGFLAPVPFFHAAFRLRTRRRWAIAVGYGLWWLMTIVLIDVPFLGGLLLFGLILVATVHAFVLREAVFAAVGVPWRAGDHPAALVQPALAVQAGTQTAQVDLRGRIHAELERLTTFLRRNRDALPAACVPLLESIVQDTRTILGSASGGPSDRELQSLSTILTDYLPSSINAFQKLPAEFAATHRNLEGRTPAEELQEQLQLLRNATADAAASLARNDAIRLHEQTAFLRHKFPSSELDLDD